jgi:prevent-host-death family protein
MAVAIEISATDAVRKFSELLNAVKYRHDSFTIVRGGKPLALITPLDEPVSGKSLKELAAILKFLPRLASDGESFAAELDEIIAGQPTVPERSAWG